MTNFLKTVVLKPVGIPHRYLGELVSLFNDHLDAGFTSDDMIPYFESRYDKFLLLTSADEQHVYACTGMTVLDIEDNRFIYTGALVAHPDYRKYLSQTLYRALAAELIQYRLASPFQKMYIFGGLVSPIPYAMIAKYVSTLTPSPEQPVLPDDLKPHIKDALLRLYPGASIDADVKLMYPAHSFEATIELRKDMNNPNLDFYLQQNPEYRNGVALIFCIPLTMETFRSIFASLIKTYNRQAA